MLASLNALLKRLLPQGIAALAVVLLSGLFRGRWLRTQPDAFAMDIRGDVTLDPPG